MNSIEWYFDFVSPFAYIQQTQFHRLPKNTDIQFKPILFAGLLNHYENKGPAEIPSKRQFTYRHTLWLARQMKVPFRMPSQHPFNPLKALRLALALGNQPSSIQQIFNFIWVEGHSTDDSPAWSDLIAKLGIDNADEKIADPKIKQQLIQNTNEAIALGVFGVPTFRVNDELFWGVDATDMFLDYLNNPQMFDDSEMLRISNLPQGISRK